MEAAELFAAALAAPPDSAERILYATAGFNALVEGEVVLVGGAAQVTHTGISRLTDIDVTASISEADAARLGAAGFVRDGRHWVLEDDAGLLAIEVPAERSFGVEPPERITVADRVVSVIAVNDLMMDRLIQATDGTPVTNDEALQLAVAAYDRIDWQTIGQRAGKIAVSDGLLRELPALAESFELEARRLRSS